MNTSIADLRKDYTLLGLSESDVAANPFQQFQKWFDQAIEAQLLEPNAMTLATATPEGRPSARVVLLKGFDERGFIFYTNYNSHKGQELAQNPWAALVFLWTDLERQVRVEGRVEKVSDEESDHYFHSRPPGSRLGAWTSDQSQVISGRDVLEQRLEGLKQQYQDQEIPRPSHWGGYRVIPDLIEFWQGRPSRLHDRLQYRLCNDGNWQIERLSP
ncbi:pyridoxamine 5'-phosphate oxidase [Leptolyngbya sp. FACHB-261]|uniref:pyridoxamine 5'-phosphate oxidase n=1 Tax=Leptolyngbya sp. FACHB-261 TaxID=2692806 RepID=UPI001682DC3E|nr:pyridoxamine 5'-phosphate oxidase [Leptolyngbya sp. FACHB-261]MBD2103380.1 pyridoxamine 5'-phosphate oxidase [Leptolyngbya sp. FACHB-261]